MKAKREQPDLRPSEWYFLNCPEREIIACCHYEYARSSKILIAAIEEIILDVDYYEENPRSEFAPFLTRRFPRTAWLDIPAEERTQLMRRFETEDKRRELVFTREQIPWAETDPWKPIFPEYGPYLIRGRGEAVAVFQLKWERSNDDLKGAFQRFLQKYRPKGTGPKQGRVESESDWLNALGAKRMMFHCARKAKEGVSKLALEAMRAQVDASGGIMELRYSDPRSLASAAGRAKGYLLKLYGSDIDRREHQKDSDSERLWAPAIYADSPADEFWS